MALVSEPRALFERRRPVRPGLGIWVWGEVGCCCARAGLPAGRALRRGSAAGSRPRSAAGTRGLAPFGLERSARSNSPVYCRRLLAARGAAPAGRWRRDRAGRGLRGCRASSAPLAGGGSCARSGRRSDGTPVASWPPTRTPRPASGGYQRLRRPCHRHDPWVASVGERSELLGGPGLGVQHNQRPLPGRLAQQRGDPACVGRVRRDHQPAGVPVPVGAQRPEFGVGFAQDPRQPVGKLGRDRRAIPAAGLARAQGSLKARLDHLIATSPRQRPVISDKAHRPADPIQYGIRVGVGDIRLREPAGVVANTGDRGRVGAKWRPRQQQPPLAATKHPRERLPPRELLPQVVRFIGDHQHPTRSLRAPTGPGPWRCAYVTATPSNPRGGRGEAASGASSTPSRLPARAHWRVSGPVGHATTTDPAAPEASSPRASSNAGRVLPAPGAAESKNEPRSHRSIAASARTCQERKAGVVCRSGSDTGRTCDQPPGHKPPTQAAEAENRRSSSRHDWALGADAAGPRTGSPRKTFPTIGPMSDARRGFTSTEVAGASPSGQSGHP